MRVMRSRQIRLVLLASTTLTVAGCDGGSNDQQAKADAVQEDVTLVEPGKCADVGLNADGTGVRTYTPEYCAQAEADARSEFEKTAPLYAYREDCIAQHGEDACRGDMKVVDRDGQEQAGYMPAFGGFVVGTAAALAAAHIFHTMQGNAVGRVSRPIPVYQTLNETCRANTNAPNCRAGGGGSAGGGGGRAGYSYGYNGYTVAETNGSGRTTATVTKTANGGYAPYNTARASTTSSRSSTSGSAGGSVSGSARSSGSAVSTTARGGFGGSAAGHAGGGGGHGGGGT